MLAAAARRSAVLIIAVLMLAGCVGGGPGELPRVAAPDYLSWPHDQSDLKPDPRVRFGVLPNGMRYALIRNAEPKHSASLRLRIAAGSLQEADDQKGLAHFLEHMAFNGSKHFAEGEAVKALQRKGLAFGPHTNAHTGLQETVYVLELPEVGDNTINTALRFMRDVADGLTLAPDAIDRERGVVMSEERQGDTPERRVFNDRWKLTYSGHQAAERLPIGDMQVIRTATRQQIADFYNRYYRPERAALVIAGDIDVAAVEAKIKAAFSDWERGAQRDGNYGVVNRATLRSGEHVEPNLPDDATMAWLSDADDAPDSIAMRRERSVREVGFAVLNRRLSRMARGANPPFVSASASRGVVRGVATVAALSVNSRPGSWSTGMAAAEQELRRTLQFGVRQDEVDREVAVVKAVLDDLAAKADTRYDKVLADTMIEDIALRRVFTDPRDDVAIYAKTIDGLTAAAVTEALRRCFGSDPSMIFASGSEPIAGGDAVRSAYLNSHAIPVEAEAEVEAKDFPYTQFGQAGVVARREEVGDLGVTLVQFANGVRLNVKPTAFEKDAVIVKVRIGGGYLVLPRQKVGLFWALPFGFIEGGLKQLTTVELERALAGRIVSADLSLDEDAFELSGKANTRDFDLQLELLAAFATEPAYRGEGLARLQTAAENYLRQYSSSPGRVLAREASGVVRSNDARWRFPTLRQIQSISMSDVQAVMSSALRQAPIEITIAGDVDVDKAISSVAATFGAFAPRDSHSLPSATIRFPRQRERFQFTHDGRGDQAVAYAAWPGPDFPSNPRQARTLVLLRDMMKVRLTDEFREKQGATYSPFASSWASGAVADFGFIAAGSETPPASVNTFYETLASIVKDLRRGAFDEDLVERARRPIVETALKDRRTNEYWANALESAQTFPWTISAIRSFQSDMESIGKAELVTVANKYLVDERRIDVRVLPKQ
ncbi:MAG: insulinase family protein [Alphaproteobacteria bacterium]|nr:insulinase family protein [Alphaproteobacteria bacterium]